MKNILSFCLYLLLLSVFISCKKDEPIKTVLNETVDTSKTKILAMGNFTDNNTGHKLSGKALFIRDTTNNDLFLRFENFSVIAGPDVNVYLSKTNTFQDVIDLGDLKATNGDINYDVGDNVNISEYKYVLIWCIKFSVLFGDAKLE